ncbi:hypothetical protein FZD47_02295 [Bacillus infantis]|uniref:Uncharacterized protein n=1 Tax=Bacillus infantis TaxID=324767 RepID=A0A5D4SVN1_9BACI|nr:hypothetical protein [Bacillus infantis]TYS66338.1 hypothetical protein FZD47_02295 [Bacillus infantis]
MIMQESNANTVPATVNVKGITDRIAYYTRKVAERGFHHPSKKLPRAYTFRSQRLLAYKKRMNKLVVDGELPACPQENR